MGGSRCKVKQDSLFKLLLVLRRTQSNEVYNVQAYSSRQLHVGIHTISEEVTVAMLLFQRPFKLPKLAAVPTVDGAVKARLALSHKAAKPVPVTIRILLYRAVPRLFSDSCQCRETVLQ